MITSVAASWHNLPADILFLIAERSEIRLLRAVCSSWRSSLPLPSKAHHPLRSTKIPIPLFYQDQSSSSYLTLTERNIYCLGPPGNDDADSPESCLILKLEEMSSGKMRFYNPLSHRSDRASDLNLPAAVDFLDCRVILVGKEYAITFSSGKMYSIKKVVLSDDAMLCRFDNRKLGYFKFGDERWTMIVDQGKDELSYFTSDIIYHNKKFYVVDVFGKIIVFDSSLKVKEFVSPARVDGQYYDRFFVQSDDDLLVVDKCYRHESLQEIVRFKVYRLNSENQQWNQVTNLGDQSLFIGFSIGCACFSIGSGQFPGCGKNFIYCADRTFIDLRDSNKPWHNMAMGIFSLEDNSSLPLHMNGRYSRLFWPIPSWLKQG